jgi:protein-S-isoprenylcysteine O-methyltransferase Ste14
MSLLGTMTTSSQLSALWLWGNSSPSLRAAGIALALVSFVLLLTSRAQLGSSFTVTPQARALVSHGIYSRIRHPMYLFVDLTIVGLALALEVWYVLVTLLVLVPLQVRNARKESRLLLEKFGATYEQYRSNTWF